MGRAAERHASRAQLVFAALLPAVFGFLLGLGLVAAIVDRATSAIVWLAAAVVTCCVAVAVIVANRRMPDRSPWPWALGSLPATLLGPLAILLLLVPRVRRGLTGALARSRDSAWPLPRAHPLPAQASDSRAEAPALAPTARRDLSLPIEALVAAGEMKQALKALARERTRAANGEDLQALRVILALGEDLVDRAAGDLRARAERIAGATRQDIRFVTRRQALARRESWLDPFAPDRPEVDLRPPAAAPAPVRQPRTAIALVGVLIASIAAGAIAFLIILTLAALGGGDYTGPTGNHYLYPHTYQVILLIGTAVAACGVVVCTLWWLARALTMRRLAIALLFAALALAAIAGMTGFMYGQGGPDPRPANVTAPTVAGSALVGVRLKAERGAWTSSEHDICLRQPGCYRFSFKWERCQPRALSCRTIRGATGPTQLVAANLVGYRLRVSVTAESDAGIRTARSAPTRVVVES
jgi:hypothetical protein